MFTSARYFAFASALLASCPTTSKAEMHINKSAVTAEDIGMALGTMSVAMTDCHMPMGSYPISSSVAKYGYDISDFLPSGKWGPYVNIKILKAREWERSIGHKKACAAFVETVRAFFPEQ